MYICHWIKIKQTVETTDVTGQYASAVKNVTGRRKKSNQRIMGVDLRHDDAFRIFCGHK
jgi:hypothetical protein